MKAARGFVCGVALLLCRGTVGLAAPPAKPSAPPPKWTPPAKPAPPLPFLPSLGNIEVELTHDAALVTRDFVLPRGAYTGGALSFHLAYGAPGAPLAVEASLLPVEDGALAPHPAATRATLAVERSAVAPASAYALSGKADGAGVLVHVPEAIFREATRPGGMAVLRYREVIALPLPGPHRAADIVVRLGMRRGAPLALGRLVVEDKGFDLARAEARLCGADADPHPLAVSGTSRGKSLPKVVDGIAPVLAVRRPTDDLCFIFTRQ